MCEWIFLHKWKTSRKLRNNNKFLFAPAESKSLIILVNMKQLIVSKTSK